MVCSLRWVHVKRALRIKDGAVPSPKAVDIHQTHRHVCKVEIRFADWFNKKHESGKTGFGSCSFRRRKVMFWYCSRLLSDTTKRCRNVLWDNTAEGHLLHKTSDGDHGMLCLVLLSQVRSHWPPSSSAKSSMQ